MKNYLINGNFDIWQRGTSFSAIANVYTADRFQCNNLAAGTISRQAFDPGQTDVPGNPTYYWQMDRTTAAASTSTLIRQRIEDVASLSGEEVTFSFYAQSETVKTFQVLAFQNFGTGGSPSPSSQVIILNQAQSIGTMWTRYTYTIDIPSVASPKKIGTNGNDYVGFLIQEASGFSTFRLDTAQWQVELGASATAFEERPIGVELPLAQRYYFKTYDLETDPGTTTITGLVNSGVDGITSTVHHVRVNYKHPVKMRGNPTITIYSRIGTAANWTGVGADANASGNVLSDSSEDSTSIEVTTASGTDSRVRGHIVGDAEL